MPQEISFGAIQDSLNASGAPGSAAEAHGLLCGMLCRDSATESRQWLNDYFDAELEGIQGVNRARLQQLYGRTRRQLADFDFSFNLCCRGMKTPFKAAPWRSANGAMVSFRALVIRARNRAGQMNALKFSGTFSKLSGSIRWSPERRTKWPMPNSPSMSALACR